jgi:hypothetical protein
MIQNEDRYFGAMKPWSIGPSKSEHKAAEKTAGVVTGTKHFLFKAPADNT